VEGYKFLVLANIEGRSAGLGVFVSFAVEMASVELFGVFWSVVAG
jgi:hypothetical protein